MRSGPRMKPGWYTADGFEVGCNFIAGGAIATGCTAGKHAAFVAQINRYPVDFGFNDPIEGLFGQEFLDPIDELPQICLGVGVIQARHRFQMADRFELLQWLTAD